MSIKMIMTPVTIFVIRLIILSIFSLRYCHMSILRKGPCRVTNLISNVTIDSMTHVDFKKSLRRHVEFRGQGPYSQREGGGQLSVLITLTKKSVYHGS